MSDFFIGEIRMFSFAWAPRNWALCNGAILPINQYQALYALLGSQFGGDGKTTFALPDLRGRTPLNQGNGADQRQYLPAVPGGSETVTLTAANLPAHTHSVLATTAMADRPTPIGSSASVHCLIAAVAQDSSPTKVSPPYYGNPAGSMAALDAGSVSSTGGNGPHNNLQPFAVVNFCIATVGVFPSRQ